MCVALVVGNMIGSGIFLLPASLAPYGLNSVAAWLFTAGGAMLLAVVFAALTRAFPTHGGPFAFTGMAFGDLAAFIVAWGYWISIWVGNAAIATGTAGYLGALFPDLAAPPLPIFTALGMVWLLTVVNVAGARAAGGLQMVTTVLKLAPLIAIVALGVWLFASGEPAFAHAARAPTPFRLEAVTAAATLTLWALLGVESATVPAGKVRDPQRTIPRATLIGTGVTALVCILACTTVILLVPAARLAASPAPFADVATRFWGPPAGRWLAAFAAISGFGCLNGWVLLQGEVAQQMARQGVFPALFARQNARGAPVAGLLISAGLVTLVLLLDTSKSTVQLFSFLVLLSTTASLALYLACSLAALRLMATGRMPARGTSGLVGVCGLLAAVYALWAIAGAGISTAPSDCGRALICWARWSQNPVYLGAALLALGAPVYYGMRRRPLRPQESRTSP
jgi:APA family basic amino acid/polyamine antiporter